MNFTKEECQFESLKYVTRTSFYKGNYKCYEYARLNGWLDDICSHIINSHIKWSKENCQEIASKYNNRQEFIKNDINIYNVCVRNKWLDDVCSHMYSLIKHRGYWTKEKCLEELKKYK